MNNIQTMDALRQAVGAASKEQEALKPGLAQRVIWCQDEDTGKWVLVGLSETGEVQDPEDYADVPAPLPDQPSGRIWARDDDGNWTNVRAEASKEETARAQAALRRAQAVNSYVPKKEAEVPHQQTWKPARFAPGITRVPGERSRPSLSSVHQNYALRLSGQKEAFEVAQDPIAEEDSVASDGDEGGVRYHKVKPGDTFNFICLKYKISADALRAANDFNGNTLQSAPRKLVIPSPSSSPSSKDKEGRDAESTPSQSVQSLQSPVPSVSSSVATEKVSVAVASAAASQLEVPDIASPPPEAGAEAVAKAPESKVWPPPVTTSLYRTPPEGDSRLMEGKKGEEGVRYHWVEPDDSLRWICLKYKVNANDLRRANNFTGSNLKVAPKKLIIPPPSKSSLTKSRSFRRSRGESSTMSGSQSQRSFRDDDSIGHSSFFSSNSQRSKKSRDEGRVVPLFVPPVISTRKAYVPKNSTGTAGSSIDGTHGPAPQGAPDDVSVMTTNTNQPAPMSMVHLPDVQKLTLYVDHSSDSSDSEPERENSGGSGGGPRYHNVRPNDTVEYLCMKYRVSAAALRRANIGLTGRNLQTGPKRLIIPASINTSSASGYYKKNTSDTATLTTMGTYTHADATNSMAFSDGLSDGHSTLAEQIASLNDGEGSSDDEALYHDVQPSDTLQGLCLLYGVTAFDLRRANNFRGLNLAGAPERLVIPQSGRNGATKGLQDMTEDEKIQKLVAHLPKSRQTNKPLLSHDEARAYLEYNEWNFDQALRNAKVDSDWSSQRNL